MPATFSGFSPRAITFLRQLAKNNAREWFQPRKDQFEELLRQPMLELTGLVVDQLRSFAVDHVREPAKAVHRIYRDVRFSKDKSPYKTNISAMFPRKGLGKMTGAGYFFSISATQVDIAGGCYMPGPPELAAIRKDILANLAAFRNALENPKRIKLAGGLQGEQLARPPKGFDADHPAIDLLRRKQFYYYVTLPVAAATSPGLEKVLVKHFKAMSPAVEYLNRILLSSAEPDSAAEPRPARPKPMF
jgi:uncharacterized protein (TIGR02453 family)